MIAIRGMYVHFGKSDHVICKIVMQSELKQLSTMPDEQMDLLSLNRSI